MIEQYEVARDKLLRYNFIVITEMLRHPDYVSAVERFFGVPGVDDRSHHPWCEVESHYSNQRVPLVVHNETLKNLTRLNAIDIGLYNEVAGCLKSGEYDFPVFDPDRFKVNVTIQADYTGFERKSNPSRPSRDWLRKFDTHVQQETPDSNLNNSNTP